MKDTVYRAERHLFAKIQTTKRNIEVVEHELHGIVDYDSIRKVKESYQEELVMLEYLYSLNEREM